MTRTFRSRPVAGLAAVATSTLFALAAILAVPAHAFRLDSNFGVTATTPVNPRSMLPTRFIHWDLREFDNCTVPYSIDAAGTQDSLANGGFDAIDRSFASWSAVFPTPLRFQLPPPWPSPPDRKSTRLNSSHPRLSRMPSSA